MTKEEGTVTVTGWIIAGVLNLISGIVNSPFLEMTLQLLSIISVTIVIIINIPKLFKTLKEFKTWLREKF